MTNNIQGYKFKENEWIKDKWEMIRKVDSNLSSELHYGNHIGKHDSPLNFTQYCHLFAQYLLTRDRIGEYRIFVKNFNNIISKDSDYHYMEGLYKSIMSSGDEVFIQDCTLNLSNGEFKKEKTFSDIVKDDLESVHGIVVEQEVSINNGRADLLIDNQLIELKISKLKYKDIFQVVQYVIENDFDSYTLIGSGIQHEGIFDISNKYGISIMQYGFNYEAGFDNVPYGMTIEVLNGIQNHTTQLLEDVYNNPNDLHSFSYRQDAGNIYEVALNKINNKVNAMEQKMDISSMFPQRA